MTHVFPEWYTWSLNIFPCPIQTGFEMMLKGNLETIIKLLIIQNFFLLVQNQSNGDFVKGSIYFAIAAPPNVQSYGRAFNRTLSNITQNILTGRSSIPSYNLSLETVVIDLPENGSFSSGFLESVCDIFGSKRIIAVLIVGHSPAAFTVSLTARHAGIPVLWARGDSQLLPGFRTMVSNSIFKFNILKNKCLIFVYLKKVREL